MRTAGDVGAEAEPQGAVFSERSGVTDPGCSEGPPQSSSGRTPAPLSRYPV